MHLKPAYTAAKALENCVFWIQFTTLNLHIPANTIKVWQLTKTFCNPPWACKHTFKLAFVFCHRPSRENMRSNQLSQVLYPRASHYIKRSLFISCLGRWMLVLFSFRNPNSIICWHDKLQIAWIEFSVEFVRKNESYIRIQNRNSTQKYKWKVKLVITGSWLFVWLQAYSFWTLIQ